MNRIRNSEGYTKGVPADGPVDYYYYSCDHLGNNREVWHANADSVIQRTQYYPSGLPWDEGEGKSEQPYKYNGKEFVEMHGWDTYEYGARGYYPAMGRFTVVDPLAEKYYGISPYAYCAGNPIRNIDVGGEYIESVIDGVSLATGVSNLIENIRQGNTSAAVVDVAGIVTDALALALPCVPGGAGVAIKTGRAAERVGDVGDVGKGGRMIENAAKGKAFEDQVAKTLGQDKASQVTIEVADGTRTRVDFVQSSEGKITLLEAKSSQKAPLTSNQKKAYPQIEKAGGTVKGKKGTVVGLPHEQRIPPTKVEIIRPEDLKIK